MLPNAGLDELRDRLTDRLPGAFPEVVERGPRLPGRSVSESLSTDLPDADVLHRVRAGEPALFGILVSRYGDRLSRIVRAVVKDESDAKDVVQQTYLNALEHLNQFAERSQFSTWLIRIGLHEAFRFRRRSRRTVSLAEARPGAALTGDPEREVYAGELRGLLARAVRRLPRRQQVVLTLRDINGLSTAEAGVFLGISPGTVKTRLHRARALVRRELAPHILVGDGATADTAGPFCDAACGGALTRAKSARERDHRRSDQRPVAGDQSDGRFRTGTCTAAWTTRGRTWTRTTGLEPSSIRG